MPSVDTKFTRDLAYFLKNKFPWVKLQLRILEILENPAKFIQVLLDRTLRNNCRLNSRGTHWREGPVEKPA